MATFLEKLPVEIRNQIYEDLLLYRDGCITLNFDGNAIDRWEGDRVGLHTAILRICKQAYAEGSNVLYGHNHFRYCPTAFLSISNKIYGPLTSVFQKIKHLEVARRDPKAGMWFIPGDICSFVNKLAEIMQFLNVLGCSLKTLSLKFVYHSGQFEDETWRVRRDQRYMMWSAEEAIKTAFKDIQVGTSIAINLDCFDEELGALFEEFSNKDKFKERWTMRSGFRKTTIQLDDRRNELWDDFSPPGSWLPNWTYDWDSIRYSWTWTLTPVAKVRKIPGYSETDETTLSDEEMD